MSVGQPTICRACGKIFPPTGRHECPECADTFIEDRPDPSDLTQKLAIDYRLRAQQDAIKMNRLATVLFWVGASCWGACCIYWLCKQLL